jgi:hypothetical protein
LPYDTRVRSSAGRHPDSQQKTGLSIEPGFQ